MILTAHTFVIAAARHVGVADHDDVQALVELKGEGEADVVKEGVWLHPQQPLRLCR